MNDYKNNFLKCLGEIGLCSDIIKLEIEQNGLFALCEPACGGGGMIIACTEALLKNGFNPQQTLWFEGTDNDINSYLYGFTP